MIDYSTFEYLGRRIGSSTKLFPVIAKDTENIIFVRRKCLRQWDLKSDTTSTIFESEILQGSDFIRLTPNQKYILVGACTVSGYPIYALNSQTGEVAHHYKSYPGLANSLEGLVITADGQSVIASESSANHCYRWDIETGKEIQHITAEKIAVGDDPKLLAHARLKVLKLHEFRKGCRFVVELPKIMNIIAMNRQNTLIAVAYKQRSAQQEKKISHAVIQIRNCVDGAVLAELHEPELPKGSSCSIQALEFSPDSQVLVSSDISGNVTIWDLAEQKILYRVDAFVGGAASLTFSPDGRWFAVSHTSNRSIKIWGLPGLFEIGKKS